MSNFRTIAGNAKEPKSKFLQSSKPNAKNAVSTKTTPETNLLIKL